MNPLLPSVSLLDVTYPTACLSVYLLLFCLCVCHASGSVFAICTSSVMPLLPTCQLPAPVWPNCSGQLSTWLSAGRKTVCPRTESSTPAPTSCTSMILRHSTLGNARSQPSSWFSSACIWLDVLCCSTFVLPVLLPGSIVYIDSNTPRQLHTVPEDSRSSQSVYLCGAAWFLAADAQFPTQAE